MKKITLLLISAALIAVTCKTTRPVANTTQAAAPAAANQQTGTDQEFNFSDPASFILGYFNIDRLTQNPYSSWYQRGYDDYSVNSDPLNKLLDIKTDDVKIKIVMGTWCPDSRREVPKLMRVLDIWRFPLSQVTVIGVDKAKKAPVNDYESLNIQRVPTFIIYKNNIEAGRIIENPVTSLEQDIVNILTGVNNINK